MSTRAAIGMEMPDGTVRTIGLHFDGYPAHAGAILDGYYKTQKKVEELIALGEISTLGIGISKEQGTVAYRRDKGEDGYFNPQEFRNAEVFWIAGFKYFGADFIYLYSGGKWFCKWLHKGEIMEIKTIFGHENDNDNTSKKQEK